MIQYIGTTHVQIFSCHCFFIFARSSTTRSSEIYADVLNYNYNWDYIYVYIMIQ